MNTSRLSAPLRFRWRTRLWAKFQRLRMLFRRRFPLLPEDALRNAYRLGKIAARKEFEQSNPLIAAITAKAQVDDDGVPSVEQGAILNLPPGIWSTVVNIAQRQNGGDLVSAVEIARAKILPELLASRYPSVTRPLPPLAISEQQSALVELLASDEEPTDKLPAFYFQRRRSTRVLPPLAQEGGAI